jgi:hypothetical protein
MKKLLNNTPWISQDLSDKLKDDDMGEYDVCNVYEEIVF